MSEVKTTIEVSGFYREFYFLQISKKQYDKWAKHGLPTLEDEINEFDECQSLRTDVYQYGLLPDESLSLEVNGRRITNLHTKINIAKNFEMKNDLITLKKDRFYPLCSDFYRSASFRLELSEKFEFKKLRWKVMNVNFGSYDQENLLLVSYDNFDLELDYEGYLKDYRELLIKGVTQ